MTEPNPNNFCGGCFQDWLEVMLLPECNGKCSWCVERKGWHPKTKINTTSLIDSILMTGKKNVILLGGEPTLHKDLGTIINKVNAYGCDVYLTTNGSKLTPDFVSKELKNLTGINISLHHFENKLNKEITGLDINYISLAESIKVMHRRNISVRFNCNLISGYIDNINKINDYVDFAKEMGADSVRFSELKNDEDNFVDVHELFGSSFGLNNDPFLLGCNTDTIINDLPVNFRQMCGLQTTKRPKHDNPKFYKKSVLYYDGIVYDGWKIKEEREMEKKDIEKILKEVKEDKSSVEEASSELLDYIKELEETISKLKVKRYVSNCQY